MDIRDAREADIGAILEIHNHAVLHSTAVWTDEVATLASRTEWFNTRIAAGYPVIVADVDGVVAGYASYGQWRVLPGYRHTVENSVYVSGKFHRRGVAEALMVALLARAKSDHMHVIMAGIEAGNLASVALHRKLGFRVVAQIPEVGIKFGRWLDLVYMQYTFDPGVPPTDSADDEPGSQQLHS